MLSINCKGRLLVFDQPKVMGILNITPDSFYSGSRTNSNDQLLQKAEQMLGEGAAILDIGGQSTRPGSQRLSAQEESERVVPAIELVNKHFPHALISVDTFYASVAVAAVEAGAAMVNDISAGTLDPDMFETVARLKVPYVLTHLKGEPATMQSLAHYDDVVLEVFDFLQDKISVLRKLGVTDILADPGYGFAKTATHNFQLLQKQPYLQKLGVPLMTGVSRKATVYKTLGITAEEALNGSTVLHTIALQNGANVLRVHDVREAVEAVRLVEAFKSSSSKLEVHSLRC